MKIENISKYFPLLSSGAIVGGAIWIGQVIEQNKVLQFTNPEMKVQTEYHVKSVDPVGVVRNKMRDSIKAYNDSVAEVKFRRVQDSVDQVRDSLTRLNVRLIYNTQKQVDSTQKLLRKYIKMHDPN